MFTVTMTENLAAQPPLPELADKKDALAQCTGRQVDFLIAEIHNFKTNDYTPYLFVFNGEKMIASVDLKTDDARMKAMKVLSVLK